MRLLRAALLFVLVLNGFETSAHAWTEAQVETVVAKIDLADDGSAEVEINLALRVDRGWMEGLELTEMEPDMELVGDPVIIDEDNQRRELTATPLKRGRLLLSLTRRRALRRGRYQVKVHYRTQLAPRQARALPEGPVRYTWTLPGWRTGLNGVQIHVTAPPGTSAVDPLSEHHGDEATTTRRDDGRVELKWHRVHLPRTVPWTVEFDVPPEHVTAELAPAPESGGDRVEDLVDAEASGPEEHAPLWEVLVAVLLCAFLGIASWWRRKRVRSVGARTTPLVKMPALFRFTIAGALASCFAIVAEQDPEGSLILLAAIPLFLLDRPRRRGLASKLGTWRTVNPAAALRLAPHPKRTPALLGALAIVIISVCLWFGYAQLTPNLPPNIAPFVALPFIFGAFVLSARSMPRTPRAALAQLMRVAKTTYPEGQGPALRFAAKFDNRNELNDVRLTVETSSAIEKAGIERLQLAVAEQVTSNGYGAKIVAVVRVEADSPSDEMLSQRGERFESATGEIAHVIRLESAFRDLANLFAELGELALVSEELSENLGESDAVRDVPEEPQAQIPAARPAASPPPLPMLRGVVFADDHDTLQTQPA